jgi:hypothetical protein
MITINKQSSLTGTGLIGCRRDKNQHASDLRDRFLAAISKWLTPVISISFLAGCATQPSQQATAVVIVDRLNREPPIRKDDLSVQLTTVLVSADCKALFGFDPLKEGIIPVHVTATNLGNSASFQLLLSKSYVSSNSDDSLPAQMTEKASRHIPTGQMVGTMIFGGLMGVGQLQVQNAEQKFHLGERELVNGTISPGKGIAGFVYFQAGRISAEGIHFTVVVKSKNLDTQQEFDFRKQPPI